MLEEYAREFPATKIIGSGGNINRLFRLASLKGPQRELPVERLQELYDTLQTLTVVQRMEQFKLKEDRADVIVPAAEIFLTAAEALGSESIIVPNISLADSITDGIWHEVQMKV